MKKEAKIKLRRGKIKTDAFDGTLDELYHSHEHYRALAELAGHVTAATNIEAALDCILDALNAHTGSERSLVLIFNRDHETVFQKGRHLDQSDIRNPGFEVSWSIINKVRKSLLSVFYKNALEDSEIKKFKSVLNLRILSVICTPILYNEELIGVFYADNRNIDGIFDESKSQFVQQAMQFIANHLSSLLTSIELNRDLQRLEQKIAHREKYAEIIGNSPKLKAILNLVDQVADTTATVLIEGESGTGKELIARALHNNSSRRTQRFVSLNCGALPDTLLESELFGHVKGAFTGALYDKKGWFETADGGTIFFDEISEMSAALQVKLLRILQAGEFSPVGGSTIKKCDVRIIAATNIKLTELIAKGVFRNDLFYRLNILNIDMPPLRERRDDILLLADFFLKKHGRPDLGLSADVIKALMSYDFPGNVRELENAMHRVAVLCRSETIAVEHLPVEMHKFPVASRKLGTFAHEKERIIQDFEKQYIIDMLTQTNGNVTQAAHHAGMDTKNFHQKMDKYRIVASAFKKG